MNCSTLQKRLFALGMSRVNFADMRKVKITDFPEYSNLEMVKHELFYLFSVPLTAGNLAFWQ